MRLQILSDLHGEGRSFQLPQLDVDAVVLAGDVYRNPYEALGWMRRQIKNAEIIYVLGNHEHYWQNAPEFLGTLRRVARSFGVHLLENESVRIGDAEFFGATLWCDFNLYGDAERAKQLMLAAGNEYKRIKTGCRHVLPDDIERWHRASVAWLQNALQASSAEKRVVVTHHAPSVRSIAPEFSSTPNSVGFASNLDELVEASKAQLWIHGHTHVCRDYLIGGTRVICNPRGYREENLKRFNPELVLEV